MEQEQINRLLNKYLAGNCTPEEEQAVLDWLNSQPQQGNRWNEMSGAAQQEYLAELFRDVRRTIGETGQAAGETNELRPAAGETNAPWQAAEDASHPPVVQMETRSRSLRLTLRIAAVTVVVLGASLLYLFRSSFAPVKMNSIATANREIKRVYLPDSSLVVLNGGSTLRYAEDWKAREVQLEGEAYFEVKASPEHPFVIRSGVVRTRVLGTSFNIHAYPEDERISVGVITGKVEVSKEKSTEKILIASGEMGVYDKPKDHISYTDTKDSTYNAWIEGKLNFYHAPLSEVAATLERTFGINIHITKSHTKECEITGRFHVNQSSTEILTIICKTINAECTIAGAEVTIDNNAPCH